MRRLVHNTLIVISFAFPLALSCEKEEEVAAPYVLKSIEPMQASVTLGRGKGSEISFHVDEPGYSFNYDVQSPDCVVSLKLQGGREPEGFALSRIIKTGDGDYTATITDLGTEPVYRETVCLVVKVGDNSYITSRYFTVASAGVGDGDLIVKTGLPIVYVDTWGKEIDSKETDVRASLKINGIGRFQDLEEVSCRIRGRGNTTWCWPKKPYLVKMDEKQSVFGLPKHKRWVLLANFMDRTLMRNIIAFKVGSMMSNLDWTPHCQSVELVLNGKHQGTYLLVEPVRADDDRVPCEDGFLFECDFHYDNPVQWMDPHGECVQMWGGIPFAVKYPDSKELTPQQLTGAKALVSSAATAIYDGGEYSKYIDVASFIDYWIVFEVMGNHELGNPGSVYMHTLSEKGRLVAGPVWDFDWGILSYRTSPQAQTGLLGRNAIWYAKLFDDPVFKAAVRKRWNEVLPSLRTVPSFIDETEKALQASSELNFAMWNPAEDASMNNGSIINGDENMNYNAAVALLKQHFQERLEVISNNL